MSKSVSIIIPNYIPDREVAAAAGKFVRSLERTVPVNSAQIIVVSNGKNAGRFNYVMRGYFSEYVKPEPVGYARAVNIGLSLADGDYLFVLNNDLVLPSELWLEIMIHEYEDGGGKNHGVLSAMDYPCPPILYDDSWYALWMTDRRTFQRVGYLDESLPYRFHDQDYSIRMHKAGYRVQRTGKVVVEHAEGTTYKKMGVDEGPEVARMKQKHGAATYKEWREMGGRPLGK